MQMRENETAPLSDTDEQTNFLDQLLKSTEKSHQTNAVNLTSIHGINSDGYPLLQISGRPTRAESLIPVCSNDIGKRCAISFVGGDMTKPIIVGLLWQPHTPEKNQSLHLKAKDSIVIECGKSSLSLEKDGSVRLKGITVTTQAYGSNRVKGAAVKIN